MVDRRVGVVERPFDRADDALQQVGGQLVQLRAAELHVEVLGLTLDRGDEGQVDLGLLRRGELDLRLLRRLVEALQRVLVGGQVDALVAFELGDQPLDDRLVPVVAAEVVVAGGRLDLEDAVADFQHRDVEGAAAEVEDEDRVVGGLLVEPVGERGRGRLVDDPLDLEPGDLAGVLGRLALVVVEVGGDGDHGAVDRFAQLRFGIGLQLLQDHRADLRRAVLLAAHVDADVAVGAGLDLVGDDRLLLFDFGLLAAHEALDREDRVLRVHHRLALGDGADEAIAGLGEGDDRRGRAPALGVLQDGRLAALQSRRRRSWSCPGRSRSSYPLSSTSSSSSVCLRNLSVSMADLWWSANAGAYSGLRLVNPGSYAKAKRPAGRRLDELTHRSRWAIQRSQCESSPNLDTASGAAADPGRRPDLRPHAPGQRRCPRPQWLRSRQLPPPRQRPRPWRPRQARPDGDDPEPLSGIQPRAGARSENPASIRRRRRADLRDRAVHELPPARRSDRRRDRGKGTGPDRPAGGHEVDDRRLEPAPRLRLPRHPAKRPRSTRAALLGGGRSRTTRTSGRRRLLWPNRAASSRDRRSPARCSSKIAT